MYYLNVIDDGHSRKVVGVFDSEEKQKQYQEMADANGKVVVGVISIDVSNGVVMNYLEV